METSDLFTQNDCVLTVKGLETSEEGVLATERGMSLVCEMSVADVHYACGQMAEILPLYI